MGNYPSTANYSPSSSHWTFATGKLLVKDRLTFFLVDSQLKKKNPTTPKTPHYRQFIPRPGLSSGWDMKKMQAIRSKGYFKERWVPARAQLCCHCSGKKQLQSSALHLPLPVQTTTGFFYFLFNAHWAGFKADSSYWNWTSLFLALGSKTHKPPTLNIIIILEKQTQI